MSKTPILQQSYSEGYRDGWGQASQVSYDDAYHNGFIDGQREAPTAQWFLCGMLLGSVMGVLTGIFIP